MKLKLPSICKTTIDWKNEVNERHVKNNDPPSACQKGEYRINCLSLSILHNEGTISQEQVHTWVSNFIQFHCDSLIFEHFDCYILYSSESHFLQMKAKFITTKVESWPRFYWLTCYRNSERFCSNDRRKLYKPGRHADTQPQNVPHS